MPIGQRFWTVVRRVTDEGNVMNRSVVAVLAVSFAMSCVNANRTPQNQGPVAPGAVPTGNGYPPPQGTGNPGGVQPIYPPQPTLGSVLPATTPTVTVNQNPGVIEFRIAAGTGQNPWNTKANPVQIKLPATGSVTLRIINDDTTPHVLHTDGVPCPHGNIGAPLKKGDKYDCVIRKAFDSTAGGVLYDHNVGESAFFYVKAQK